MDAFLAGCAFFLAVGFDARAGAANVYGETAESDGSDAFGRTLELAASDGDPRQSFGAALALDGERALIGAPGRDGAAGEDSGGAYVFERSASGLWTCADVLVPSAAYPHSRVGEAVALDGSRALLGAPHLGKGFAYVFERDALGDWVETQTIVGFDAQLGDLFGASVALDGEMLWCGAPFNDHGAGPDCGMVYNYRLVGTTWVHVQETQSYAGDLLGSAIAIDGGRGVAGGPEALKVWNQRTGRVLVLEWDPLELWKHTAWLVPDDAAVGDRFGAAVALDGARVLVGAPGHDSAGQVDAGAAYVFERVAGGAWTLVAKLTERDPRAAAGFGGAVALDGGRALVGAGAARNAFGAATGAACEFERTNAGAWIQVARLAPFDGHDGERLGAAVALDGPFRLVGAPGRSSALAPNAGVAVLSLAPALVSATRR